MHIVLAIYSLECGGAERVLTTLANRWAETGHRVTVVTLAKTSESAYFLHPAVDRVGLGATGIARGILNGIRRNLGRIASLRRTLKAVKPDIVVSFMDRTNISILFAARGLGIPVVATEHCDPVQKSIGPLWRALRCLTYPWAYRVVSVSRGIDAHFSWLPAASRAVVYNPIYIETGDIAPDDPPLILAPDGKYLLGMGRLTEQKGFDLLIPAFARLAPKYPDWSLIVLGEGPQRPALTASIEKLGLGSRCLLPGQFKNPFGILERGHLFVFPSRYEGFPCALLEAMACGLPAVSFDCPTGPNEIIGDGLDGILVPPEDVDALERALDRLMGDEAERARLAANAKEVSGRFGLDETMRQWDLLLGLSERRRECADA